MSTSSPQTTISPSPSGLFYLPTEIKSEAKQPTMVSNTNHDTMVSNTNHDAVVSNTSQGTIVSNTNHDTVVSQIAYSLRSLPCDGKAVRLRVPKKLFEHLELMAIPMAAELSA
jgi:hypothetical protein